MAQAGAAAQAVYTQGSCARLMLATMEAQSCRARTMAVTETAAAEAGNSGGSGDSRLRWEGECEVTKWTTPSQG